MKIKNTKSLVTGASKGIGAAIAIELAKNGSSVIINYNSDKGSALKVKQECDKYSKGNLCIQADITDEKQVKKMFTEITKKFKSLDILVNNAGIFDSTDNPTNINAFQNIFEHNFLAHIKIIGNALRIMKKGKIINISSIHGMLGQGRPTAIAYSAMKSALNSYTKNLAKDLAPKINVNAIAPGKTITPLWGEMSDKEIKEGSKTQLINRWVMPEEIAHTAIFLIENDAVCGEIITVDGGGTLVGC